MSHNPNTIKSQDDLIKKAFENQNDDLIKNALNSGYIKSQDDLNPCNDGKRSSDVLIEAISKAERLQKQLDIAVKCLEIYALENLIAVSKDGSFTMEFKSGSYSRAKQALKEIEDLNK